MPAFVFLIFKLLNPNLENLALSTFYCVLIEKKNAFSQIYFMYIYKCNYNNILKKLHCT